MDDQLIERVTAHFAKRLDTKPNWRREEILVELGAALADAWKDMRCQDPNCPHQRRR